MAARRMFAKSVIQSARFLRLSPSARLLYYDLGMAADDEGVVEAFTVMLTSGANEGDLTALVDKGFVTVLNDDLVSHITDWNTNNYIQSDRFHQSVYHDLISPTDTGCIHGVSKLDTEVRLELGKSKDKLDQDNLIQEKKDEDKAGGCRGGGALHSPPEPESGVTNSKRNQRLDEINAIISGGLGSG